MNAQEILDNIATSPERRTDVPTPPPVELVAFVVRWARSLRHWKVSTLADFARVSVSTVERVERAEKVSNEALDRIALALGYEMGAFHAPRIPLGPEQAAEEVADTLGNLEQVAVAPMKTHRAVREATNCQAFLVHRPDVPDTYDQDIANLVEWLDFASFSLAEEFHDGVDEMPARRQLYNDILGCVTKMERRGLTVLVGVMHAPQPKLPDWKVAILSITPKLTDPGAIKRSHVFVDRRNVAEYVIIRGPRLDYTRYLKPVSAKPIYRASPVIVALRCPGCQKGALREDRAPFSSRSEADEFRAGVITVAIRLP